MGNALVITCNDSVEAVCFGTPEQVLAVKERLASEYYLVWKRTHNEPEKDYRQIVYWAVRPTPVMGV